MSIIGSIVKFIGHIYIHKYPMFITYKPTHHLVLGGEVRKFTENLETGDILVRRYKGYLSTFLIPGYWSHAGIYIGNNRVIHAVGKGVINEDILTFCRTDSIAILRPINTNNDMSDKAVKTAEKLLDEKVQYDYEFESNDDQLYCTEMVNECYQGIFDQDFTETMGKSTLSPDSVYASKMVELVLEIKH